MSLGTFRTIVDKISFVKSIGLFNWGEPFLNPEIFEFVKYAKKINIKVVIHSNFCLKKDEKFFHDIVNSGLDELIISLDGASQESYSKYRVGGDFNLVTSNLNQIVQTKKMLKSDKPGIIWKFIVHRFNEHEIEKARTMAQSIGVIFQVVQIGLSDDLPDLYWDANLEERKECWLPQNNEYIRPSYLKPHFIPNYDCLQIFETMVINPDGKVFPCCNLTSEKNTFGDLLSESFHDIWNGNKYQQARNLWFSRYVPRWLRRKKLRKGVHIPCSKCFNIQNY